MVKSKGLGRGLSALIGESTPEDKLSKEGFSNIAIENIMPNPDQPRVIFNASELEELASSIKQNGLLQPILVRPMPSLGENKYQIIAGERRWRASKMIDLASIPAIIKDMPTRDVLEVALIENIQRENLSSLEEAEGYKRLINECQYTQERLAEIVSKSRSHIANLLRLLNLPEKVKQYLNEGLISLGHAKLLVNQKEGEEIADLVVNNNLNVRETEDLIREKHGVKANRKAKIKKVSSGSSYKDENILALEEALSESLGLEVKIDTSNLSIKFQNLEDLDMLVQKLSGTSF
jgi:ParB family transcriptional regulator, chromosome partitioning protein